METGFQLEHWSTAGHWLVGQAPRLLFFLSLAGGRPFSSLLYIYTSPCRYHGNMVGGGKPPPGSFFESIPVCTHGSTWISISPENEFFFIFWAFYFSFTRSFDLSNVHRHIWVGSPLGHSLRYTPPFFWNRIGNPSTFITNKNRRGMLI